MADSRKIVDIPLPKFSLKTLKNIYLKLDLPHWYNFFVLAAVIFGDSYIIFLQSIKSI